MGEFDQLVNDTAVAFEESTGEPATTTELGEIKAVVRDYLASEKPQQ